MDRGPLHHTSLMQQVIMGWWNNNNNNNNNNILRPISSTSSSSSHQEQQQNFPFVSCYNNSPSSSSTSSDHHLHQYPSVLLPASTPLLHDGQDHQDQNHQPTISLSQLLLEGYGEDQDEQLQMRTFIENPNNWSSRQDDQLLYITPGGSNIFESAKQHGISNSWSTIQSSSPRSCITITSCSNSGMLDFSNNNNNNSSSSKSCNNNLHNTADHSSECNSTESGSASKKAKLQASSSAQSTFKVRKEKLGDRISALHQLVSPFGKTDTASVLQEAIGYIRFLHSQIEALSSPYLANNRSAQQYAQCHEGNNLYAGNLQQGCHDIDDRNAKKDLRSRGLCLVPVSCTTHVWSTNGADYWASAIGGGFR